MALLYKSLVTNGTIPAYVCRRAEFFLLEHRP